jgi:nucleotide-binding universal stress UspA family protein
MANVLLASEGRPFSRAAIAKAVEIAGMSGRIQVFSIARVFGVALGFPNPWLLPSKQEWKQQRDQVADAVAELLEFGFTASGGVAGTRNPAKRINAEAARLGCDAIVMGADPPRHWIVADLLWSQEPYRIKKKAKLPIFLV